ncbi:MAG: THUMP domain-containing protein [Nitrospirota bacterium]
MQEWNVVINVNKRGFRKALEVLHRFGSIKGTDFFNVLLMKAEDVKQMLEVLRETGLKDPESLSFLSRLIPVTHTFIFSSPEEFENKAKEVVLSWLPQLAGKGFYVRMRRRGQKGKLASLQEEQFLDNILLEALGKVGTPGHITFDNPDMIIAVETVGNWAGLSLWTKEDLERYPFIKLD